MAEATENWVILKTYEKDGRIFCVEWRCDRTTNGYMLPYGGENRIDVPSGSSSDVIVAAIMADIGPSQLENIRSFNSDHALYMQMKEQSVIVDYTSNV